MGDRRNNYAGFGRRPALRIQQSPSRSLTDSSSAAIVIRPEFSSAAIGGSGSFHDPAAFRAPGSVTGAASDGSPVVSVSEENTEVFAIFPSFPLTVLSPRPPRVFPMITVTDSGTADPWPANRA